MKSPTDAGVWPYLTLISAAINIIVVAYNYNHNGVVRAEMHNKYLPRVEYEAKITEIKEDYRETLQEFKESIGKTQSKQDETNAGVNDLKLEIGLMKQSLEYTNKILSDWIEKEERRYDAEVEYTSGIEVALK